MKRKASDSPRVLSRGGGGRNLNFCVRGTQLPGVERERERDRETERERQRQTEPKTGRDKERSYQSNQNNGKVIGPDSTQQLIKDCLRLS